MCGFENEFTVSYKKIARYSPVFKNLLIGFLVIQRLPIDLFEPGKRPKPTCGNTAVTTYIIFTSMKIKNK